MKKSILQKPFTWNKYGGKITFLQFYHDEVFRFQYYLQCVGFKAKVSPKAMQEFFKMYWSKRINPN